MASVNKASDYRISSDAVELMDSMVSGFDDLVWDIAGNLAKARRRENPTRIEAQDVRAAIDVLMQALKEKFSSPENRELLAALSEMSAEMDSKAHALVH